MERSKIALKSGMIGLISQFSTVILSFLNRTIFINYLGPEILGLDGVLKDCISMLSLADLGIQSAMTYQMYKAVINEDKQEIGELLTVYKQIYNCIAVAMLVIGVFLSFTLDTVITGVTLSSEYVYIAFWLFVLASASSYALAYKRSVLMADQKQYVCTIIDTVINILVFVVKAAVVLVFNNYLLYLFLGVVQNIVSNLIVHRYVNKYYSDVPKIKEVNKEKRKTILKQGVDVFGGKIATYIYTSTDNIVVSIFQGTISVGILSNYKYVFNTVKMLMNCTLNPMQALLGNYLNSVDDKNQTKKLLYKYTHLRYVCCLVLVIPAMCLAQSFIYLWAGDKYLLTVEIPILLAADFYIAGVYGPLGEYMSGLGMFKISKYVYFTGAFANILTSIIAVQICGVKGVLYGTVLSQSIMWVGSSLAIFFKYFEDRKALCEYWIKHLGLIVFVILLTFGCFGIEKLVQLSNPYITFVVRGILMEALILSMYLIVFSRTDEFRELKGMTLRILERKRK